MPTSPARPVATRTVVHWSIVEWITYFYFLTHVPITLMIDVQAILPAALFPQPLRDVVKWYANTYQDPYMTEEAPPPWFQSFIWSELFLQLPTFILALYAYHTGGRWIRMPLIAYGAHVATTVAAILAMFWLETFPEGTVGPKTTEQRIQLTAFYAPYLICPLMLVISNIMHPPFTLEKVPAKMD